MAQDTPPVVYFDDEGEIRHGFLIYRGKTPLLVISWRSQDERRVPHVYYELEPDKLKQLAPHVYRYTGKLLPPSVPY